MRLVRAHTFAHNNAVYGVAFAPDGKTLATASLDNQVKLWRLADGTLERVLKGHGDGVAGVGYLADGRLVSASLDKSLRVWRPDGTLQRTLPGHAEYLTCVAVAPEGGGIVSGGFDRQIRLWNADADAQVAAFAGGDATVQCVAWRGDARVFAGAGDDNSIRWFDATERAVLRTVPAHAAAVEALAFDRQRRLISGGADGRLKIWSAEGTAVTDVDALTARVKCLAVHPTGEVLAVGGSDGVVRVWKLGAGLSEPIAEPAHRNTLYGIAFSPDGTWLAAASFDRSISVWRWEMSAS